MQSPEEWRDQMSMDGEYGDQVLLQLAADILMRDIVIVPVFQDMVRLII